MSHSSAVLACAVRKRCAEGRDLKPYMVKGLTWTESRVPPDLEACMLERLCEQLRPRLVVAIVGEKDVRHARPRLYGPQRYMSGCGRSNLASEIRTLRMALIWAMTRLISREDATGNFRARPPLVTWTRPRKVGAHGSECSG